MVLSEVAGGSVEQGALPQRLICGEDGDDVIDSPRKYGEIPDDSDEGELIAVEPANVYKHLIYIHYLLHGYCQK